MLNHPQAPYLCSDCGIAIGPEWWLCPICERRWRDSEGQPNWPAWKCDFCDVWGPHEIQICYWCCSPREPDPRTTDPFARERAARDSTEPMDFFGDEHEDPNVGERLVPDPPLAQDMARIGRPLTEAERDVNAMDAEGRKYDVSRASSDAKSRAWRKVGKASRAKCASDAMVASKACKHAMLPTEAGKDASAMCVELHQMQKAELGGKYAEPRERNVRAMRCFRRKARRIRVRGVELHQMQKSELRNISEHCDRSMQAMRCLRWKPSTMRV